MAKLHALWQTKCFIFHLLYNPCQVKYMSFSVQFQFIKHFNWLYMEVNSSLPNSLHWSVLIKMNTKHRGTRLPVPADQLPVTDA